MEVEISELVKLSTQTALAGCIFFVIDCLSHSDKGCANMFIFFN